MIKGIISDLEIARRLTEEAQDKIDKSLAQLSILEDTSEPVTDIKVTTKPHHIMVSLKSKEELDIRYQFIPQHLKPGEDNAEKVHSIIGNIGDVDEDKPIDIWVGRNGYWNVQITSLDSDYKSKIYSVKVPEKIVVNPDPVPGPDPIPEPAPEPIQLDVGFWYSDEVPDNELKQLCTIGQSRSANLKLMKPVVDSGLKVVPSIGGFNSYDSDIMLRKKVGWYTQNFKNIGHENIPFIILRDEPNHLANNQLEVIADEAKKEFGDIESTYTYTRGALLRGDFHRNASLIGLNLYPLFQKDAPKGYVQINSYEDFKNHADDVLSKARKEIPNVHFAITAQTFYTRKGADSNPWGKPSIESAEWYMRYIKESGDIKYLLFWEWQNSDKWIGLESMPELQQAWVKALKKYLKNA